MNPKRELPLTYLLCLLTAGATLMAFVEIAAIGAELARAGNWFGVGAQALFATVFAVLTYGFFVYFVTRIGHLRRLAAHVPADQGTLEALFDGEAAALAVLVPSYREETAVVRRTLLSAALQDYPRRRVVLLIDDPPRPATHADAEALKAMRRLPRDLEGLFDGLARRFRDAEAEFARRRANGSFDPRAEARALAGCYAEAAEWFRAEARRYQAGDHGDRLFCAEVVHRWEDAHRARAIHLTRIAAGSGVDRDGAHREYRRLAALFRVEFASFERKRYENLSHEANKAMNLNSYLALMGKSFCEERDPGGKGLVLREVSPGRGTLNVPDAELVLTLDADSVLLPDYALRLAQVLREPGNERVAVVQTPYSAFPDAPGILERVAGATTDIQYLIHQGFTRYGATFWVGANALLRKAALEDICVEQNERGYRVRKYIQDRTVIEDTESSIDLVDRGWTLHNYPERLAYSATPPDFGSLLIQRRRWANGGLIILPKALRYLWRGPWSPHKAAEALCRVHYLTSVAFANAALLVILFGDFERNMRIVWLPVCGLPYMLAYAWDLVRCGYRWTDFLRVYALNLLLVPVHLGGALRSLQQAVTGTKAPFGRTPKVPGRTAAPGTYVVAEYALVALSAAVATVHVLRAEWLSVAFALVYLAFGSYALVRFMGLRASAADLRLGLRTAARARGQLRPAAPGGAGAVVDLSKYRALEVSASRMDANGTSGAPAGDRRRTAAPAEGIVVSIDPHRSGRKAPGRPAGGNDED